MSSSEPIPNISPFPNLLGLLEEVERGSPAAESPAFPASAPPVESPGAFAQLRGIAAHLTAPAPAGNVSLRQLTASMQTEHSEAPAAAAEEAAIMEVTSDMLVEEISIAEAPGDAAGAEEAALAEASLLQDSSLPTPPDSFHEEPPVTEETATAAPEEILLLGTVETETGGGSPPVSLKAPFTAPSSADLAAAPVDIPDEKLRSRGLGLVVGGAGLVGLAALLAWFVGRPLIEALLEPAKHRKPGLHVSAMWIWLAAWPVLALTAAGVGSLRRRRWALPVVHAGGWLAAISVLMILAVASAGFFFLAPPALTQKDALRGILRGIGWAAGCGVALPLVYIAIYQRRHLPRVCHLADPKIRWTDSLTEPAVMLWLSCLAVAVLAGALFFPGVFPALGQLVTGETARMLSAGAVAGCVLAALLVSWRLKAGWWLALLLFTALASSTVWTLLQTPWEHIRTLLGLPENGETKLPGSLTALLAGAVYAPLSMVLLMSRSSFHREEEIIVPSGQPTA
ncbi:MAG: hypothetical protein KA004_06350 [Verrucomicrobiales bacterium]|nr:hypothetical protein [Verrucomicrobiales bacterium]